MKLALFHDNTSLLQVSHKEEKVVADHLQDNCDGTVINTISVSFVSLLMTVSDHVLRLI